MNKLEENKIPKVLFSVIAGLLCGFLTYFLLGIIVLGATIKNENPILFKILAVIIFVVSCGLFIWTFVNSPTIKKMWGRICASIGSIILLFPVSVFVMMVLMTTNLSENAETMGITILSSMGASTDRKSVV